MLPWRSKLESEVTNKKGGRACQAGMEQVKAKQRPGMIEEGGGEERAGCMHRASCGGAEGRLGLGRVSAQVRHSGARLPLQGGQRGSGYLDREEAWGEGSRRGGEQWTESRG